MSNNGESRVIRPDGMPSDAKPFVVKLCKIEIPMTTGNPEDLARLCLREVQKQHPLTGVVLTTTQMAMTADTALVLLETALALKVRDEKIEALEERLAELERRFEDPAEHDRGEGFDG